MILIPVQNAGQRNIFHQLFQRNPYPLRVHPDAFGCIADAEHAHTFPCDKTLFPQGLQSIAASVMLGDHAQAGGAAVHGVELDVVGERNSHFYRNSSSNIVRISSTPGNPSTWCFNIPAELYI